MIKELNGRLHDGTTTTQSVYKILEIVFKFVSFRLLKLVSESSLKFFSGLV